MTNIVKKSLENRFPVQEATRKNGRRVKVTIEQSHLEEFFRLTSEIKISSLNISSLFAKAKVKVI